MKRKWIIALGFLDIIACIPLFTFHFHRFILDGNISDAFTGALPILLFAIFTLTCGVYTILRRKGWGWAVAGLFFAGAGGIYIGIIVYFAAMAGH